MSIDGKSVENHQQVQGGSDPVPEQVVSEQVKKATIENEDTSPTRTDSKKDKFNDVERTRSTMKRINTYDTTDFEETQLLREEEREVYRVAAKNGWNPIRRLFLSLYVGARVSWITFCTMQTFFCIILTFGYTIWWWSRSKDRETDGTSMEWILLSFMTISPMVSVTNKAFGRREKALHDLSRVQSVVCNLYCCHCCWDWSKPGKKDETGRAALDASSMLDHTDHVLHEILALCDELRRFLLLPTSSHAAYQLTKTGRQQRVVIDDVGKKLRNLMAVRMARLCQYLEELKDHGFSASEGSRSRQWEQYILTSIENLRKIKTYRTPIPLRNFVRFFSFFLPPMFAPYYVTLGEDLDSAWYAIFYALFTSAGISALYEVGRRLEDPFFGHQTLDGINVDMELGIDIREQLLAMRKHFFPHAKPFDLETGTAYSRISTLHIDHFAE